ncbi:MAG: rod shape-determining protein [Blastocatellia bacterium]|nr:MAG: rod shape-determining protein [Blastocatellia bacterium]
MSFRSKTPAFTGLSRLRNLIADSMAINMGSAATIIYVRGRGVVVDEPSLIALDNASGEVIAVGTEAQKMYGREARGVTVFAPMVNGVVADFEKTKQMLAIFAGSARSSFSHFSRRALMSVLTGITPVERRAFLGAAEHARIGRVWMVEEGLAAALGAGVRMDDPRASVVINVGGGTTSVTVIANGDIVHATGERIGASDINAAIVNHVRRHRGLSIGAQTAERLKLELASATVPDDLSQSATISGRDVVTGSPAAIEITAGEIYPVAQEVVRKIVDGIAATLTELPPEVAGDVFERGLILTGGGSLFGGIDAYLRERTKLFVFVADEPRYAIVRGLAQLFDEPKWLRHFKEDNAPALLADEAG